MEPRLRSRGGLAGKEGSTPSWGGAGCVCKARFVQEHQYPLQRQVSGVTAEGRTEALLQGQLRVFLLMSIGLNWHKTGETPGPVLTSLVCQDGGFTKADMVLRSCSLHSFRGRGLQVMMLCL